jgi:hypothetical protein
VTNPEQYSLISLTITEVNARTLSFHGYFSCAEGTCDGGTTRVPLGGKNKSAPLKARFKVEKVQVEIRIRGVLRRLLHVRLIERVSDCTMCPARNEYLLHPTGQSGPAITPIPSTAPVYSSGG